ncbi:MAG TPA: TonB-dependent receptor [Steroidobacteraceae bacterium]|nr:TonB-dependent receptor [Steroidobacteraceae bacterium]
MAAAATIPAYGQDQDSQPAETQTVIVTGSRIVRQDYEANSPLATVSKEALTHNADVTLETALNNLPQIVAGGTTTTNNPGNNGQANIDLRGLGANRNLVLVDGRRPMVSANDLTVDLNTIPAALIDSVEVITGGAGAVYGADAVAGVVNIKLKHNFEGFNLSSTYSDSTRRDSQEYNVSAVLGGNFADNRGNAVFAFDRTSRESLLKGQRDFSVLATSTTTNPPQGVLRWNGAAGGNTANPVPQAAVDAVFAKYGVAPGEARATSARIGFNQDNTLFAVGTFNSPFDVQHFTDPIDQGVNTRFFPDFYSYNFDPVNLLTLPLNRNTFMTDLHYEVGGGFEVFGQGSWTQYKAATGLAPSPTPGVAFAAPGLADPASEVASPLITPGASSCFVGGAPGRCTFTGGIPVPVTNPFIPADLAALLAARTGDDNRLVGSGADEPFLVSFRPVAAGLRQENFQNTVINYLGGIRGPIGDKWHFEAYFSEGRTQIDDVQQGNIDTQKVTDLLAMPDGGASVCDGGFNIFGQGKLSQDCLNFVKVTTATKLTMRQRIGQAFVTGDLFDMPAGAFSAVLGAEYRGFDYNFDPGTGAGPISGFNTQDPEAGSNEFRDIFTEIAIPLLKDAPAAQRLDLTLGYRFSRSEFTDDLNGIQNPAEHSNTYKVELGWQPVDAWRFRTSFNRAVRAPNFAELFQGGGSFPQIFDPCSLGGAQRAANPAAMRQLCIDTGVPASAVDTFVGTPGSQAEIDTGGNTALKPEKADTFTFGVVFGSNSENQWLQRLRSSVDYYKIKVKDAILVPDPNVSIAECYNYYGTNPTFSANDPYCAGLFRTPDIAFIGDFQRDPDNGVFAGLNEGRINTSGVDIQVDWGFDLDWIGAPASLGSVSTNLVLSRLIDYKLQDTPGVGEIDYAGTVNYFGGGISLGQTFPDWRAVWNTQWNIGKFALAARARYIDKMDNRASRQFIGETFKGVGSVTYWDFAAAWKFMDRSELRIGLNNAFDKQPPTYDPNVQSGTDPSTYDVIGRRAFVRVEVQF